MNTVVAGTEAVWGDVFDMDSRVADAQRVLQAREADIQAIQQMAVTNQSTVREHTVSGTTHGRRNVYGVTGNFAVIGSGSSTTSSTTTSSVSNAYTLEIQYLMGPTQEPRWLTLPFGEDRQEAEDWRLMISWASQRAA